jgi:hypothetical protein
MYDHYHPGFDRDCGSSHIFDVWRARGVWLVLIVFGGLGALGH